MTTESVSFRITRTAEDLAHTVTALSHRLVRLEQRLAGLELQMENQSEPEAEQLATLDGVERLLIDCRTLLEDSEEPAPAPTPSESPQQRAIVHGYEHEHLEEIETPIDEHGAHAFAA